MRHARLLSAFAVCAVFFLSGCGSASAPKGVTATTTAATATPASLPTVDASDVPAACQTGEKAQMGSVKPFVHVGDLLVTTADAGLSYPSAEIAPDTAVKPMQVTSEQMSQLGAGYPPVAPNLHGDGGYSFLICNPSAQSVIVQSVSARVASFTPFSGRLAAWNACRDGYYDAQAQRAGSGGCGGGIAANEVVQATFANGAGVGATVTATQVSSNPTDPSQPNPFPALPMTLASGQSILVVTSMTPPTASGLYTFSLGLSVNSDAPVFFSTTTPVLLAPITEEWSGQNCMTDAMQAQIPTSSQSYYICPPA